MRESAVRVSSFIDLHIDTLLRLLAEDTGVGQVSETAQTDLERLATLRSHSAVWAACSAYNFQGLASTAAALRMIARGRDLAAKNPGRARLVLDAADFAACSPSGPHGVILGLEGAHPLEGSLEMVAAFHDLGVRVLTLCWNTDTVFATGCKLESGEDRGLSPLGRDLLHRIQELGWLLDLAHASPRTLADCLAQCVRPVMVSHTAAAALRQHVRNLSDDEMRAVAAAEGLIGITLCPSFLAEDGRATVGRVADHILHALSVVGECQVAIGTDFDGVTDLPQDIAGAQDLPRLFAELAERGLGQEALERIAWRNAHSFLRAWLDGRGSGGGS